MSTRAVGIRSTLFLATALLLGQAAQAQFCPNNPPVAVSDTCLGDNSLLHTAAGGFGGTATGDTAVGFFTLENNTTGGENTAIGAFALYTSTTASYNTAVGYQALSATTTGGGNTAMGVYALQNNQVGPDNTALGEYALNLNTGGGSNTAIGGDSMANNLTGTHNSALGWAALYGNVSGGLNTAVGFYALVNISSGSDNVGIGDRSGLNYSGAESNNVVISSLGVAGDNGVIRIGSTHTKAFLSGVYGTTSASGTQVLVNSSGQLGTTTSSLRFKEEVRDMGAASSDLLRLRPVTFLYKPAYDDGQRIRQYGLIAEEVAAVNPGLVQLGEDGQPLAVRYHFIYAMLLNEVQKQHATMAGQTARLAAQTETLDRQAAEIASQRAAIEELASRLAKLEQR